MKTAEIRLPYFKQGDDLQHHLSQCATVEEALEAHAENLEQAAQILRKVKAAIAGQDVSFNADTHLIQVCGPDALIESLIAAELAYAPDEDEEYDEDDPDGSEEAE
jgi:hypothetical protein